MAGKKRVLRLRSQEPFVVPWNQLVLCSPQVGEPRITLSTALSIAGPEDPACRASVPAGRSLTPKLSCENQSSPSRTHPSAAAGPWLFLSPQEAGGQGRAGLPSREVLRWK